MSQIKLLKNSLIADILSCVIDHGGSSLSFTPDGFSLGSCAGARITDGVGYAVGKPGTSDTPLDAVPAEFLEELRDALFRAAGRDVSDGGAWVAVRDEDIVHVWINPGPADDGRRVEEVGPDYYAGNGTPSDPDSGEGLEYLFTKVRMGASPEATVIRAASSGMPGDDAPAGYCLGAVYGAFEDGQIRDLHDEWRAANPEPDCDSEFVVWLVKEKGFTEAPIPNEVTI